MESKDKVIEQFCSGRFLLAMAAGLCLIILTLALVIRGPEFSLSKEAIAGLITLAFASYFHKDRKGA